MRGKVNEELKKHFKPEFLNRVDEIIVFPQLSKQELLQIVDLFIKRLSERMLDRDMTVELTLAAKERLIEVGFDPALGARPLRRAVQHEIEDRLSREDPARRAQLGRPRARRLPRRRVRVHHVAAGAARRRRRQRGRRDRHRPGDARPRGRRGRLARDDTKERMHAASALRRLRRCAGRAARVGPTCRRVVRCSDDRLHGAPGAHERRAEDHRARGAARAATHPARQGARRPLRGGAGVPRRRGERRRASSARARCTCMWEDLGEVRTLAVADAWLGHGVGHALLDDARGRGARARPEPAVLPDLRGRRSSAATASRTWAHETVDPEVYAELVRSHDEGVAEFLDLARVKQNTLGNTRMLKRHLSARSGAPTGCRDDRHPRSYPVGMSTNPPPAGGNRRRCTVVVGSSCCWDSSP